MTPETLAWAREVVTYSGWKWLPGMRTADGMRVINGEDGDPALRDAIPDLDDPLTALSLLVLVREALNEPTLHARPCFGGWYIEREHGDDHEWLHADGAWGEAESPVICEKAEVAALCAALKAAHERSKP